LQTSAAPSQGQHVERLGFLGLDLSSKLGAQRALGQARRQIPYSIDAATWRQCKERQAQMKNHEFLHAIGQSQTEPRTRARAEAKIAVHSSEAEPYDQTESPSLMEIRLTETFTGDIEGESPVRALQVLRDDKSASLVSVQRFRGRLGGRQGTFVLQGSEIVENGKIKATWFVVPGSGTGDLPGCAARAALKASLEKGPNERWIIGSNDFAGPRSRTGYRGVNSMHQARRAR
jgi:hypothetical protein